MDGSFSPDGRWLAYASDESGRFEVYVQAFVASGSAGGERKLISNSGGLSPTWSPNGRELLYRAGDQIMTVGYTVSGDSFDADKPRVWAANARGAGGLDLAPDGKRVASVVPLQRRMPRRVRIRSLSSRTFSMSSAGVRPSANEERSRVTHLRSLTSACVLPGHDNS